MSGLSTWIRSRRKPPGWAGVRARVTALAGHPRAGTVFGAAALFGADGHGFRLAPPLTEPQVALVEAQFGAPLPEPYRSFLIEVGAWGAGPDYGLYGFDVADGVASWNGTGTVDLGVEFRHRDGFDLAAGPDGDDDEWQAAVDAATLGSLPLCHTGCGYYDLLVVTGPCAGEIWGDGFAGDAGLHPATDEQGRVTFDRWYLGWLAAAERSVR